MEIPNFVILSAGWGMVGIVGICQYKMPQPGKNVFKTCVENNIQQSSITYTQNKTCQTCMSEHWSQSL